MNGTNGRIRVRSEAEQEELDGLAELFLRAHDALGELADALREAEEADASEAASALEWVEQAEVCLIEADSHAAEAYPPRREDVREAQR